MADKAKAVDGEKIKWFGVDIEPKHALSGLGKEQLNLKIGTVKAMFEQIEASGVPDAFDLYTIYKSYVKCNLKFYKELSGREFRREVNKLLGAYSPRLKKINDITKLAKVPGVYIIEFGKFKQLYVGQSTHPNCEVVEYFCDWVKFDKTQVDYKHPHCGYMQDIEKTTPDGKSKLERGLVSRVQDYGRLPVQSFRPLDVSAIYFIKEADEAKRYELEAEIISKINEKYLCNISRGGKDNEGGFFPRRQFMLDDTDSTQLSNETVPFYGLKVASSIKYDGIVKLAQDLLSNGYQYVTNVNEHNYPGVYILFFDKQDKVYIGLSKKSVSENIADIVRRAGDSCFDMTRILYKKTDDPYKEKSGIKIGSQLILNKKDLKKKDRDNDKD